MKTFTVNFIGTYEGAVTEFYVTYRASNFAEAESQAEAQIVSGIFEESNVKIKSIALFSLVVS